MNNIYYPCLDGLRAVAVSIVLVAHSGAPFLRSGGVGVDIFFVLSGFLITSLLLGEYDQFGSINFFNFYIRRFLRLAPCLWLCVVCLLTCQTLIDKLLQLSDALFALSYSMNWARVFGWAGLGPLEHTWSLGIEEQYYLLWPPLLLIVAHFAATHRARLVILIFATITAALYRFAMTGIYSAARIYFGLDTHCDGLLAGSAVACLVAISKTHPVPLGWSKVLGFVLSPLSLTTIGWIMARISWHEKEMALYGFALAALCSAVIIFDLVAGNHCLLRVALRFRPVIWTGKVSYGIYLWHFPIYKLTGELKLYSEWKTKLVIGTATTIVVAALSYYGIERPFLKLKGRFSRV